MEKICFTTMIAVVLLLCTNGLQAQTTQTKLDQVELMKQFIGYWKCDIAKDTTRFWDVKSYGTGLECSLKVVTRGKVVMEAKRLWGYDKRVDKYIGLELTKGMDMKIYAQWFTSNYKGVAILYSDISNPEMASIKGEAEFKSPDIYIITSIVNNKPVKTETYTRVK
ncbi:MAG TPA: hypothetical protein VIK14_09675 [Ignavibacteria bacterium]